MEDGGSPRIAICGAGISGLTLAGILARALRGTAARIAVFERAPRDRDQGYGLDLNEHGQEALARAGVYDRYWEISRQRSDKFAMCTPSSIEPLSFGYRPPWLMEHFPGHFHARPESNREKLRDVLLDALASHDNNSVRFETAVWDIREIAGAEGSTAELLDEDGGSLGVYDLVIDAMGLHSRLRDHRVHDPVGVHYEGAVVIHGMVENPEATFPPDLMQAFELYGTIMSVCDGYRMVIQRFGGGEGDNRTSMNYTVARADGEDGLYAELGFEKPTSREGGIMRGERLARVKEWIKADMAGNWDPLYETAIDCLERVTVRNSVVHGHSTLRPDLTLPLVCIGDSPQNCGLGGGGVLAMQDAIELSKVLLSEGAFTSAGRVVLPPLRAAEAVMIERKYGFNERKKGDARLRPRDPKQLAQAGSEETRHARAVAMGKSFLPVPAEELPPAAEAALRERGWTPELEPEEVAALIKRWLREDFEQQQDGCDPSSPIFDNVAEYLEEEGLPRARL